eukprot:TRINITY_DN19213_c0_g1::TRINITY_DN19213_c0_g1_i1::g.2345::m.2345 TRINITY_DN19213_c0_g1::TRINITY_DN19213_c0_g1_i1::g.2345  ORF type:complete len:184 (+),score=8.46,sp/P48353/HLJ1_YEAST/37.80/4e-12,DnaJ/PF00226.26/1.3e-15,DnaJ/PF00226.26/7.5e+03 TRINITY_DN19213_c0_g1_i1:42-593(+)
MTIQRQHSQDQEIMVEAVMSAACHYDVLGISRVSPSCIIRRAYLQQSARIHPDKNPHPMARIAFERVFQAYQILSNSKSRSKYDRQGIFRFNEVPTGLVLLNPLTLTIVGVHYLRKEVRGEEITLGEVAYQFDCIFEAFKDLFFEVLGLMGALCMSSLRRVIPFQSKNSKPLKGCEDIQDETR